MAFTIQRKGGGVVIVLVIRTAKKVKQWENPNLKNGIKIVPFSSILLSIFS